MPSFKRSQTDDPQIRYTKSPSGLHVAPEEAAKTPTAPTAQNSSEAQVSHYCTVATAHSAGHTSPLIPHLSMLKPPHLSLWPQPPSG